jgi:hypothetical protein
MSIREWLHRLNLLSELPKFEKQRVRRAGDLKFVQEDGDFLEFEMVAEEAQGLRAWEMVSGVEEAKEDFKYLTKHGLR